MPEYGETTNFLINYTVAIIISPMQGGNEDKVGFLQYDVPTRPSWLVSTNPSICCKCLSLPALIQNRIAREQGRNIGEYAGGGSSVEMFRW
jgi:hypothetical protein